MEGFFGCVFGKVLFWGLSAKGLVWSEGVEFCRSSVYRQSCFHNYMNIKNNI